MADDLHRMRVKFDATFCFAKEQPHFPPYQRVFDELKIAFASLVSMDGVMEPGARVVMSRPQARRVPAKKPKAKKEA